MGSGLPWKYLYAGNSITPRYLAASDHEYCSHIYIWACLWTLTHCIDLPSRILLAADHIAGRFKTKPSTQIPLIVIKSKSLLGMEWSKTILLLCILHCPSWMNNQIIMPMFHCNLIHYNLIAVIHLTLSSLHSYKSLICYSN